MNSNPFLDDDDNDDETQNYDDQYDRNIRTPIIIRPLEANIVLCGWDTGATLSQVSTIVLLSVYYLLSSSYYSLFAPFLPGEALKKNVSQTQVGIIFGVFELVLIILIPVFGKYVKSITLYIIKLRFSYLCLLLFL